MKAFQFRLSQLERLGQAEEEVQLRLLKESLAEVSRAEQALTAAKLQLTAWSGTVQQLEAHGLTAASLQAHRRWLPHLQQITVQCSESAQQARAAAERQRDSFRLAKQQSKVLANLRARQQAEHSWQSIKTGEKEQDELAVMAWPRREQR